SLLPPSLPSASTLSLHDALPICILLPPLPLRGARLRADEPPRRELPDREAIGELVEVAQVHHRAGRELQCIASIGDHRRHHLLCAIAVHAEHPPNISS